MTKINKANMSYRSYKTYLSYFALVAVIFALFPFAPQKTSAATLTRPPNNLGLVGYWPINGEYDDFSGNGNNFTVNGDCVSTTTDAVSGKLAAEGWGTCGESPQLQGYLSAANLLNGADEFSVVLWAKGTGVVWSGRSTFWFTLSSSGATLQKYTGTWVTVASGTGGGSSSGWRQFVVTKNSSGGVKIYSNNEEIASSTAETFYTPTAHSFGRYEVYDNGSYHFHGPIDDIRMYSRVLSENEISLLYNNRYVTRRTPSNNGLVGYWSFNEGRGNQAGDSSGNGNTGTITGATWVDGKRGGALSFDGGDDYVNVGDNSILTPTTALTISGWVNLGAVSSGDYSNLIGTSLSYNSKKGYTLWYYPEGGGWIFDTGDGSNNNRLQGSTALSANRWYFVSATWDGVTKRIYINGVQDVFNLFSGPISQDTQNVEIGHIPTWGDGFFNGLIDDVRIYNRALSATEISALANTGQVTHNAGQNDKLTDGLVGLWSFNGYDIDNSSSIAYDRSGNGNNATISGASVTQGKVGQALEFNGTSSDYIRASSFSGLNGATSATISAWVKQNSNSTGQYLIWANNSVLVEFGDNNNIVGNTNLRLRWSLEGTWRNSHTAESVLDTGVWHHWVFIFNNGNSKIYRDGVEVKSGSDTETSISAVSPDFDIGYRTSLAGINGSIDEVRIYNRALSADEVEQLYLMGK